MPYVPKPMRTFAPTVVWKGKPYYQNSVDELVRITDCLCGVAYSPECPVAAHRELQAIEAAELPGVERLQMTEKQLQERREQGAVLYAVKGAKPFRSWQEKMHDWIMEKCAEIGGANE